MIPITLEFRTDIETNGMIRAIGWNESGVKLYYDRFGSTEVESPFVEYLEHVREWSRTFFAEGREPSVTTNAAAIGIVWDDGSSDSSDGIVIRRFTVVDRNSEPILSRLVGDSVPGVYYNPSFGKTGDIIHLAVSVAPAGVDDDKIVWRCSSGGAGFVSGNTGREVVVQMGNDDAVFKIDLKGLSTNVPALELTVRHVND